MAPDFRSSGTYAHKTVDDLVRWGVLESDPVVRDGLKRMIERWEDNRVVAYCQALPADPDTEAVLERARFYQASSTLRIARNGWVSRLDRMGLVAQALALLTR